MHHAEQRAEHIGIERRGVAVGGLLRHRAGLAFGAGAVDGRIQATEARDGLIDQAAHIVIAAHVGADELRFAAELAQLGSQRLADVLMTAGNDDAIAFSRKSKGRGTPNPSQRAGNQDNGGAHIASSLHGVDMPGLRARTETVYHRSDAGIPRVYADVGNLGFPGGFGKYFVRSRSYLGGMARDMGAAASALFRGRRRGGKSDT